MVKMFQERRYQQEDNFLNNSYKPEKLDRHENSKGIKGLNTCGGMGTQLLL